MPAPELIDSAYWFETNDAPLLHHDLTLSDLAHILHLAEQELLPLRAAQVLVPLLLDLDRDAHFSYDPQYGDAFANRLRWLQARAPEAVGYLAAGRARREATTVAFRLLVRRQLVGLTRALIEAHTALLDLAARHADTLMPDYTYLQAAHPTTFAHYLLSFVYPLLRDSLRLREAFEQINQSPAGIGSTNGSSLPIRRERLATLLGFDGVITHTRDAMWQVDAPLVTMNAAATLLVHLDRLAEDLQIFNSAEFGFVRLGDEFTRPSVIMPQKKNPYPLAFVRGAAGMAIGRVTEMYAIARTPSAQPDNRLVAYGEVPRALDLTTRVVKLMAGLCASLQVCPEPMARRVEEGFTQATDLAEMLMQAHGIDYRAAHQIVGRVVRQLQARNKTARDITPALIDQSAQEVLGHPLTVSEGHLAAALDAAALVNARLGTGGAARVRVQEMMADCRADVEAERAWVGATAQRIEAAENRLVVNAEEFGRT
jgi:argininosuccinate lyase